MSISAREGDWWVGDIERVVGRIDYLLEDVM